MSAVGHTFYRVCLCRAYLGGGEGGLNLREVGPALRAERLARGIKAASVCRALLMNKNVLWRMEMGRVFSPHLIWLYADYLGMELVLQPKGRTDVSSGNRHG